MQPFSFKVRPLTEQDGPFDEQPLLEVEDDRLIIAGIQRSILAERHFGITMNESVESQIAPGTYREQET